MRGNNGAGGSIPVNAAIGTTYNIESRDYWPIAVDRLRGDPLHLTEARFERSLRALGGIVCQPGERAELASHAADRAIDDVRHLDGSTLEPIHRGFALGQVPAEQFGSSVDLQQEAFGTVSHVASLFVRLFVEPLVCLDGGPVFDGRGRPELSRSPPQGGDREPHQPSTGAFSVVVFVVDGFSSPDAVYPPVTTSESIAAIVCKAPWSPSGLS